MGMRTDNYDLTTEEIAQINTETWSRLRVNGQKVEPVYLTKDLALELLGAVEVEPVKVYEMNPEKPDEILRDEKGKEVLKSVSLAPYDFALGKGADKKYYKATKQDTNRPVNEANVKALRRQIMRWMLNGEPMIQDSNGKGISLQHRCWALLAEIAETGNEELAIPIILIEGIDPRAAITVDTGKANTGGDILGSDPAICPVDELYSVGHYTGNNPGANYGSEQTQVRKKVVNLVDSASKLVASRLGGKNINTSLPGGSNAATELGYKIATKVFPDIDKVAEIVYAFDVGIDQKGKTFSKVMPRHLLTCALTLAQFADSDTTVNALSHPNHDGLALGDVDPYKIDTEQVVEFCRDLVTASSSGEGPLSSVYTAMAERESNGKTKIPPVWKMAFIVRAVKAYMAGEETTRDMVNLKGEQNAAKFDIFGGLDRGPLPKKTKGE